MNIDGLAPIFTQTNIITFFLKAFAILFSFMYFLYAIIITRQTQSLNRSLESQQRGLIVLLSSIQIIFAIVLIGAAFVLI